jgi:hypothetical protein
MADIMALVKRMREEEDEVKEEERAAKRIVYAHLTHTCIKGSSTSADRPCSTIGDFDNIITVLVGPEKQRFVLHQEPVCARSKFFKAACSRRWLEGQERFVRLPTVKAETFRTYSSWVYSDGVLDITWSEPSDASLTSVEDEIFADVYLLGDKLDDIKLRTEATKMLLGCLRKHSRLLGISAMTRIYESTIRGSLLRKLLVDMSVELQQRENFSAVVADYPPEFVQEVAVAALRVATTGGWEKIARDPSVYAEKEEPKGE